MWASVHVHIPPVGGAPGWCLGIHGGGGGTGGYNWGSLALSPNRPLSLTHQHLGPE